MVWALRAHSSKTGCKKGAGRRAGHCMHHRQCACAAKGAQKLLLWRNPLLLFGRSLLERGGSSADLQGEVGFCRSTRDVFTSCSSTRTLTGSSLAPSCCLRQIVDMSPPRAAFMARWPPRTAFEPKSRVHHTCTRRTRKPYTPAPHLHRHAASPPPHTSPAPVLLPRAVWAVPLTTLHPLTCRARRPLCGRR